MMYKTLLIFLIVTIFQQCNSQKKEPTLRTVEKPMNNLKVDSNYLIGSWQNTGTNFITNSGKEKQKVNTCQLRSYWKFYKQKDVIKQSKFTATGTDCNRFNNTTAGVVSLKNNELTYLVDDILYQNTIIIESNKKFVIISRDFINGKDTVIEKVYEKK